MKGCGTSPISFHCNARFPVSAFVVLAAQMYTHKGTESTETFRRTGGGVREIADREDTEQERIQSSKRPHSNGGARRRRSPARACTRTRRSTSSTPRGLRHSPRCSAPRRSCRRTRPTARAKRGRGCQAACCGARTHALNAPVIETRCAAGDG